MFELIATIFIIVILIVIYDNSKNDSRSGTSQSQLTKQVQKIDAKIIENAEFIFQCSKYILDAASIKENWPKGFKGGGYTNCRAGEYEKKGYIVVRTLIRCKPEMNIEYVLNDRFGKLLHLIELKQYEDPLDQKNIIGYQFRWQVRVPEGTASYYYFRLKEDLYNPYLASEYVIKDYSIENGIGQGAIDWEI